MEGLDIEEVQDVVAPLPVDQAVLEQVLAAKAGNPSQFASHWEMDEEDINEATQEQIQNDPALRTLWAAENNRLDVLKDMLVRDPGLLNARDEDGYTPLHRAAYEGHVLALQFLLDNGANVHTRTNDGWTALHSAANWGQVSTASLLLRHCSDINAQTNGLQTPLHLAAANSDSREMLELLLMHPDVNYTLQNGQNEMASQVAKRTCRYHFLFDMCHEALNYSHRAKPNS